MSQARLLGLAVEFDGNTQTGTVFKMSSQPKPYLQIPKRNRGLATAGYRKVLLLACFSLLTLTFGFTDGASVKQSLGKKEQDLHAYATDREQEDDVRLPVQGEDELTARTETSLPKYHRILAPVLKSSEQVSQESKIKSAATASDAKHKTRGRGPNLQVLTETDSKSPTSERPRKAKSRLEGTMLRTPATPTQTESRGTKEQSKSFSDPEKADVATETQKKEANSKGQDTVEDGSFLQQRRNPGRKDAPSRESSHQNRLLAIKPLRRRAARRNLGSTRRRKRRSTEGLIQNHEISSEQILRAHNFNMEEENDEESNVDYRGSRTTQDAYIQGDPGVSSIHSTHELEKRHEGSNIYVENLFAAASALHKNTDIDEEKAWEDVMNRLHDPNAQMTMDVRPGKGDGDLFSLHENTAPMESQYGAYAGRARNTQNEAIDSSSATDEHNAGNFQPEKMEHDNSVPHDEGEEEEINLAHMAAVPEHFESTDSYRDSISSGSSSVQDPYVRTDLPELTSTDAHNWLPEGSQTIAADSYHDTSSDTHDEETEEEVSTDVNKKHVDLASMDSSVESDESEVDVPVDRGHTSIDNTDNTYVDATNVDRDNILDRHTGVAQNEGNYLRSAFSHDPQAMASSGDDSDDDSDETMIQGKTSTIFDEPHDVAHGVAGEHHAEGRTSQVDINKQMRLYNNDGHPGNLAKSEDHAMASATSEDHPYGDDIWSGDGGDARLEYADHRIDYNEVGDTHQNLGNTLHHEAAEESTDHYNVAEGEDDDLSAEDHEHETEGLLSSSNLQEHPQNMVDYAAMGYDTERAEVTATQGRQVDSSAHHSEDKDEEKQELTKNKEYMRMSPHDAASDPSGVAWGLSEPQAYYENDHEHLTRENENVRNAADGGHFTRGHVPSDDQTSIHNTETHRRIESTHR